MGFFPLSRRSGASFACYLARLLRQDCVFPLPRPGDDQFYAASAQRDPAIPSSVLFVHPASSPNLYGNEGTGLQATESPDCSTLQLCQTNQMWGWEPSELVVVKGYQKLLELSSCMSSMRLFVRFP